jgi:hypothetical protein
MRFMLPLPCRFRSGHARIGFLISLRGNGSTGTQIHEARIRAVFKNVVFEMGW